MIRPRVRDLGVQVGRGIPGPLNSITDVPGVLVGHATVRSGDGQVHTGVTAVRPNAGNIFMDRVVGGAFVLNGAGEMSGLIQVLEWGLIETPILLTNTLSVGAVSDACARYMIDRYPGIGVEHDVVIPLVGECDDSHLNDIAGGHVKAEHVVAALDAAHGGPVAEGSVGGGTGMVSFGFKGGIGTSSRRLSDADGGFMLGVLVMTNFGDPEDLRVDGLPVGQKIGHLACHTKSRYGSVIAVVATDAPLSAFQVNRLSKRVGLGLGRMGSYAAHTSGEIVLGFSTANTVPRVAQGHVYTVTLLADQYMDPLYIAAIEATEEAVLNALCAGEDTQGFRGAFVPGLPLEEVRRLYEVHRGDGWHEPPG